ANVNKKGWRSHPHMLMKSRYLTVFLLNKKWAENYKLIYGSGFIAVFCWTVKVYAIDGYLHIDLPLVLYAGGIWMWYVFFAIGFFIGKMQVRRYSLRPFIWFTPVCFLLCVMESCLLNSQGKFAGLGQHPSSILFSVFFIPLLLSEKVQSLYSLCSSKCLKIFFTFVEFVGKFSFGIYLIHCFIISPLGSIVLFPGSYLRWVVLVLGDILLCMFCLGLMKKLFPKLTRILLGV
ncbi:hypothetical protein, partial [Fibrobacter sp. UWH1]|uniref:hypothetical protein n=1 Tax=Fibrobacter sp. UWH1 TaxID=1964354 RepID=UPI000B66FA8E